MSSPITLSRVRGGHIFECLPHSLRGREGGREYRHLHTWLNVNSMCMCRNRDFEAKHKLSWQNKDETSEVNIKEIEVY